VIEIVCSPDAPAAFSNTLLNWPPFIGIFICGEEHGSYGPISIILSTAHCPRYA
jgi:hypothetical protein